MKHLSDDVINPSRCGRRPSQLLTTHLVKFNDSQVKGHRNALQKMSYNAPFLKAL